MTTRKQPMTVEDGSATEMGIKVDTWVQKLALGTVQFGLPYGISNTAGQVSPRQAAVILEEASQAGLDTLDTAAAYGSSEAVIGEILAAHPLVFRIISKFPGEVTPETLEAALKDSLARLRRDHLEAYLAHSFTSFQQEPIRERLYAARARGQIGKVGVSVYSPREVTWLLEQKVEFDLVQLPFNVFDQRFRPLLERLKAGGVEVHARSAFLQGLLLMPVEEIPPHFASIKDRLVQLRAIALAEAIPLPALLLNYVLAEPAIDKVVIGVAGPADLRQDLLSGGHMIQSDRLRPRLDELAVVDEQILLPYNWR